MLVFDDPTVGLKREPFVSGADTMLDMLAEDAGLDTRAYNVMFSATPFPGATEYRKTRKSFGGAWYRDDNGYEGWLCPATLCYFPKHPKRLYVAVAAAPGFLNQMRETGAWQPDRPRLTRAIDTEWWAEPACDTCGITSDEADTFGWCGACGSCSDHCLRWDDCDNERQRLRLLSHI